MSSSSIIYVIICSANLVLAVSSESSSGDLKTSETSSGAVLSRPRRFAAIGYLTVILVLLNTVLLIISNVVINK